MMRTAWKSSTRPPRRPADPVRGLHQGQLGHRDPLAALLPALPHDRVEGVLARVDPAAGQAPLARRVGPVRQLGHQHPPGAGDDRVGGDPLVGLRLLPRGPAPGPRRGGRRRRARTCRPGSRLGRPRRPGRVRRPRRAPPAADVEAHGQDVLVAGHALESPGLARRPTRGRRARRPGPHRGRGRPRPRAPARARGRPGRSGEPPAVERSTAHPARDRARSYSASAPATTCSHDWLRRRGPGCARPSRPAGPRRVTSRATAAAIASSSPARYPLTPSSHELLDAAARPADDRQAGRPRLQGGDPEGLQPAGGDVDVRGGVPAAQLLAGDPAREGDHAPRPFRATYRSSRPRSRPLAEHVQVQRYGGAGQLPHPAHDPQQLQRPLAAGQAHGRHHPDAVVGAPRGRTRRRRPSAPRRCRWAARRTCPAGPMMRCSGAAATRDTAFMATPRSAQRPTYPATRRAGSSAPSMQCQVMVVGSPMAVVTRAASTANGLTTPMCTCATSNPPSHAGAGAARAGAKRVDRQLERQPERQPVDGHPVDLGRRSRARSPCAPGVAVKTSTSWPRGAQPGRQVVRLDLDPAQPGQITVRQQSHLHEAHPRMRQDG